MATIEEVKLSLAEDTSDLSLFKDIVANIGLRFTHEEVDMASRLQIYLFLLDIRPISKTTDSMGLTPFENIDQIKTINENLVAFGIVPLKVNNLRMVVNFEFNNFLIRKENIDGLQVAAQICPYFESTLKFSNPYFFKVRLK
ncbi:hypothetical protein NYZ99_14055 [Maribacter litopenaei]|uniref:Uncharacterized protein n=1 Tax=Maribacter litopenaei TaxID=2976127 RepID=A0ABY5Y551_9FLAO|nr:hypothetical protein [Maribacter litopenaei]UWX54133.1 hypothetical protein NYZ99_14055 [Maribacter litopenaei]